MPSVGVRNPPIAKADQMISTLVLIEVKSSGGESLS